MFRRVFSWFKFKYISIIIIVFLIGVISYNQYQIMGLISVINNQTTEIERYESTIIAMQEIDYDEETATAIEWVFETNKQLYYVRNEILYWDALKWGGEKTLNRASYEALCIYKNALEQDIDPYLMIAIGIAENKLHHTTKRNGANAIGMFQLTPIVEHMFQVDGAIFEENVEGAAKFLKQLSSQYDDLIGVLGHYNGGSRPYYAVENYAETKRYVPEVLGYYESMIEKY